MKRVLLALAVLLAACGQGSPHLASPTAVGEGQDRVKVRRIRNDRSVGGWGRHLVVEQDLPPLPR